MIVRIGRICNEGTEVRLRNRGGDSRGDARSAEDLGSDAIRIHAHDILPESRCFELLVAVNDRIGKAQPFVGKKEKELVVKQRTAKTTGILPVFLIVSGRAVLGDN